MGCTAVLFAWCAVVLGTPLAWELLVGIESPAVQHCAWLAWPVSVLGYLVVPALIGLGVGIGAELQMESQSTSPENALRRGRSGLRLDPADSGGAGDPAEPADTGTAS